MTKILHIIFIFLLSSTFSCSGQKPPTSADDEMAKVAREIMGNAKTCALITIDSEGIPRARMMDPMKPDQNFVVWMATIPESGKVAELRNNSKASLYYADDASPGYVNMRGIAYIVEDEESKRTYWKEEWTPFYPDKNEGLVLIKFVPTHIDLVSYRDGIVSETNTWQAPFITLPAK